MASDGEAKPALLKTVFNPDVIEDLASRIAAVHPSFNGAGFAAAAAHNLDALELKARSAQIAGALAHRLPDSFPQAAGILVAAMGEDDGSGGIEGMGGFRFMPFLDFVAEHGLSDPETALSVLERMTLHFSAEFAVRPFILRDPEAAMVRMGHWATSPDWRIRRLSSEGCRPRLPWAMRLDPFIADPGPVVAILDRLYDDPHAVVRRSAANNLNDIAKDHPDLAASVAGRWTVAGGQGPSTARHGLRTLVKQGHRGALSVLGFSGGDRVVLAEASVTPSVVRIGEAVAFRFVLKSEEDETANLVVDYALDRVLANGKRARKVFKLGTVCLAPGETAMFEGRHAFRQLSTRTYYPGPHAIECLVNGRSIGTVRFQVA